MTSLVEESAEIVASDFESLETFARQPRQARQRREPRPVFGTSISPAMERVFIRREPRPAVVVVDLKPEPPVADRAPVTPAAVVDYDGLLNLLRARADELELSRETIDHISGLPSGLSSKILSLNHIRRIGLSTLGPLLDTLALKLIVSPDDEALARNRSRYVKRDDPHFRSAKAGHAKRPRFAKLSGTITARLFGWPAP